MPGDTHRIAAEMHDKAAHAHRVAAAHHGNEDHLTAHELSRQELQHSADAFQHSQATATFGHNDIAAFAHELWQARGCPEGSPDVDWLHAVKELRSRASSH